jgi:AraC-like DNA-binding protein
MVSIDGKTHEQQVGSPTERRNMGESTFNDPDNYAAALAGVGIKITIVGAGNFQARKTQLKLQNIEINWFAESLPRIAYISFPLDRIVVSFPINPTTHDVGGFRLRMGDLVFHGLAERVHQRSEAAFNWGFISLSPAELANCSTALNGRPIVPTDTGRVLRPAPAQALRFRTLLNQASRIAANRRQLVERTEVASALEQEMLHALVCCLTAEEADNSRTKTQRHAAVMVRFEELLEKRIDRKLDMARLCAELGVAERTLRMCCDEFLGISPTRYMLLQRMNRARVALQRADPSKSSVAEVARNHQFVELGRFSVTYRSIFGESPSATLHRDPHSRLPRGATLRHRAGTRTDDAR